MKPFALAAPWKARLPAHTADILEWYVNHGPAGLSSFHYLLLSGDAFGAATVADGENLAAMGAILAAVDADFPGDCYGSREAVEKWQGLMHGEPVDVPESWKISVKELRRDEPKTLEEREESAKKGRNLH